MPNNLADRAVNGLKWTYISNFAIAIIQLAYTSVMARLLDPSAFGLFAMVNIIIRFGSYFSKMGIGSSLIQKEKLSHEEIRVGFSLSLIISFSVSLVIILIAAPLASMYYKNEEIIPITQVLSLGLFITGISTISTSLLLRNFSFKKLSIIEIISFVAGNIFVGIPLAYLGFGVWSLVYATLIQAIVLAFLSYLSSRHPIKPYFSQRLSSSLLGYGTQYSLISFLEFINYNLDTFLIGRLQGSALLGIYNRAYYIINLPTYNLTNSLIKVLFPSFSLLKNNKKELMQAFVTAISLLGIVLFAIGLGASAAAREIILVVLGSEWEDAIPVLQILALIVPFNLLASICGVLFDAIAALKLKLSIVGSRLLLIFVLFIGLSKFGLLGFSIAFLFTEIIYFFVNHFIVSKYLKINLQESFRDYLKFFLTGLLSFVAVKAVNMYFGALIFNNFVLLILEMMSGLIVLALCLIVFTPVQTLNYLQNYSENKIFCNVIKLISMANHTIRQIFTTSKYDA